MLSSNLMQAQRGITLVVGLVMVLLITIIGMSAIRSSGLQEQMAGNVRDRNIAFQAAEAALREGESFLDFGPSQVPMGDPGFVVSMDQPGALYWTTPVADGGFDWNNIAVDSAATIDGTLEKPKYVVEEVTFLEPGSDFGAIDLASLLDMEEKTMFRVTSRAVGGTENTVVILQTTYN